MATRSTKPDYAYLLKLAYWTEVEIILILGIADRDGLREIIKRSRNSKKANELKFVLNEDGEYCCDPLTVIAWAIAKGLTLPVELTDWYNRQGEPKPEDLPSYLDTTHPLHSSELKIAIEAWQAVLECNPDKPNRGSRKQLIESWLNKNHPETLSKEAKSRITVLLNPDKDGGAPKTE